MRATTVLAFFVLTAFACGETENEAEEAKPEATETAGGSIITPDNPLGFDMTKEAIVGRSATVPPESEIENEGVVWLEVRTVNNLIDTAWVSVSSRFPEVDEFALNQVLTNNWPHKIGWGDPPVKVQFFVRVPTDSDGQEEPSTEFDTPEMGALPVLATIPVGSDVENEGHVLMVMHLVESMIDTVWVVESSGYPEVDEFALEHVMTLDQERKFWILLFSEVESDTLNLRVWVRHQP